MFNILQKIKLLLIVVILVPGISYGYENKRPPFEMVGTGANAVQNGKNTVYYFFLLDCPYCYDINELVDDWSSTLPGQYIMEYIPVTATVDYKYSAMAVEAVGMLRPDLKKEYILSLFEQIQRRGAPAQGWDIYFAEAQKIGIPKDLLQKTIVSPEMVNRLDYIDQLISKYDITGTPMFVVSDKYKTSLGHIPGGNKDILFQLLSGLVSEDFRARGYLYAN